MNPKDIQRFVIKIKKTNNCWLWTGSSNSWGYGSFWLNGRKVQSHRVSYELFREDIPEDMVIDHLCRNRLCVNPSHMEVVTLGENVLRGECPAAINLRKTHCNKGHELIPKSNGKGRICMICQRDRLRKFRAKQKGLQ